MKFKEIIKGILNTVKEKVTEILDKVKLARVNSRLRGIQDYGGDISKYTDGYTTTPSGRISSKNLTNEQLDELDETVPTPTQWLKDEINKTKEDIKEINFDRDLKNTWEDFINLYKQNEKRAIAFAEGSDLYDKASKLGELYYNGAVSIEELEELKELISDIEGVYGTLKF